MKDIKISLDACAGALNEKAIIAPMDQEVFKSIPLLDMNGPLAKRNLKALREKERAILIEQINEWIFSALEKEYFYRTAIIKNKQQLTLLGKTIYTLASSFVDCTGRSLYGKPSDDYKIRMRRIYTPPAALKKWRQEDKRLFGGKK